MGQIYCKRLRQGDDLLHEIKMIARDQQIKAGVVLSAVGCILTGRLRDAGGKRLREITEPCEIVSLQGTVSELRCHLHLSLSKEDLSVIGGHLVEGCIIHTTCELVIEELPDWRFGTEDDPQTGYDEILFLR